MKPKFKVGDLVRISDFRKELHIDLEINDKIAVVMEVKRVWYVDSEFPWVYRVVWAVKSNHIRYDGTEMWHPNNLTKVENRILS